MSFFLRFDQLSVSVIAATGTHVAGCLAKTQPEFRHDFPAEFGAPERDREPSPSPPLAHERTTHPSRRPDGVACAGICASHDSFGHHSWIIEFWPPPRLPSQTETVLQTSVFTNGTFGSYVVITPTHTPICSTSFARAADVGKSAIPGSIGAIRTAESATA